MRDKGTIGNGATNSFYYKCYSYLPQKVNWAVFLLFLFSGRISLCKIFPPLIWYICPEKPFGSV